MYIFVINCLNLTLENMYETWVLDRTTLVTWRLLGPKTFKLIKANVDTWTHHSLTVMKVWKQFELTYVDVSGREADLSVGAVITKAALSELSRRCWLVETAPTDEVRNKSYWTVPVPPVHICSRENCRDISWAVLTPPHSSGEEMWGWELQKDLSLWIRSL